MNEKYNITTIKSHAVNISKNILMKFDEVVLSIKGNTDDFIDFKITQHGYVFTTLCFDRFSINSISELSYFMAILQTFAKNQLTKKPYRINNALSLQRDKVEDEEVLVLSCENKKQQDISKVGTQHLLNILNKFYNKFLLTCYTEQIS